MMLDNRIKNNSPILTLIIKGEWVKKTQFSRETYIMEINSISLDINDIKLLN